MNTRRKCAALAVFVVTALAWPCQALTHVDVLVSYDTSAAQWINDSSLAFEGFAERQIALANQVLANSGLGGVFDFRLVGVHKGMFTHEDTGDMLPTLLAATDSSDSAWEALRAARNAAGADIVVVLVNDSHVNSARGLSYTLEPYVSKNGGAGERRYGLDFEGADSYLKWYAEVAFCVVDIAAAESGYVFVHEMSHVMGAGHSELLSPSHGEPGPQLYTYSSAFMGQGSDGNYYATIMGYNSTGYPDSAHYTVLPYFSSPNVRNPETGDALGDEAHDNVRTLRNTYVTVSAFRKEVGVVDGGDDPAKPEPPVVVSGAFTEKKTYISAAVKDADSIVGYAEFVVAATKKGISTVSGTFLGLNGKKAKIKNTKCEVYTDEDGLACVSLDGVAVKGWTGSLSATLRSDGSISNASVGSVTLVAAVKGMTTTSANFYITEPLENIMGGEVVQSVTIDGAELSVLPYANSPESIRIGAKWSVAKAGKLKLVKDRTSGTVNLVATGTQNFSALKLSYQNKTGAFKGSFTAHALLNGKLKKFTFNVTGVAVDGKGVGLAVNKKAGITLDVVVE